MAEVAAGVEEGGPATEWSWTWPSGLYLHGDIGENDYNSNAFFWSPTTGRYKVWAGAENASSSYDSDWAYVYVFKMDLDIDGVSDEDEDDPGGYICVNDDDDNNNTIPDKDETGTVSGEDDLVEISLSYEPSDLSPGYIELKILNNIKVWSSSEKGTLVVPNGSDYYKRWSLGSQPSTLWVEGYSAGTANLYLLYSNSSNPGYPVYPSGDKNHDPVKFTVIDVNLFGHDHILMYTGDHADDTPTQNYNAVGSPSGGTFSWECSTIEDGNGLLAIVNTQQDPPMSTVTVKGDQPSSIINDAKITVSYTIEGKTATETIYVTVHRPARTVAYRGYFDWNNRTKRYYFHRVFDQFIQPLNVTGMPCDEVVRIIYGEKSDTDPGNTAFWGAEMHPDYNYGNWPGGIAVRDVLGGNTTRTYDSKYEQDIYVGGWKTWPTFEIYIQPLEDDPWPCIWKDPKLE